MRPWLPVLLLASLAPGLSGCAVVAVADAAVTVAATAVSIGAKTVGLAADVTVGTARLVGQAVSGPDEPAPPATPETKGAAATPAGASPVRATEPVAAETRPVSGATPAAPTPLPVLR